MGKNILIPKIKAIDSIHCKANKAARELILPCLEYETSHHNRNKFSKVKTIFKKCHMITGRNGTSGHFYTGLLKRIKEYSKSKNLKIEIDTKEIEKLRPKKQKPEVKGIDFRKDQLKACRAVKRFQRGRIVFPTGSGKTIIALGILSIFQGYKSLFLVHTKDLLIQTCEELKKFGFKYQTYGGGSKIPIDWKGLEKGEILVSTIQSFSKIGFKQWFTFFDVTIIDEGHHVNNENSQYGKLMQYNLSPVRIALTATEPTKEHELLINEGLFGPTLCKLTEKEGEEIGILAKPTVEVKSVPYDPKINAKYRTYKDFYLNGIVKNKDRNKIIIDDTVLSISSNHSVLIIIENVRHGKTLKTMLKSKGIDAPFVQGSMLRDERNKIKNNLKSGKLKVAICTKVWREGINIPIIKHIIYAAGMKDEKMVKQAMGRGLRIADGKSEILLTDFLDPYPYLAQHSIIRYSIYEKLGWIK